nr:hypothetical protein [Tanacetum cinerariifolium]
DHDALLEPTSSKPYEESSTQVPKGSGNPNPTASTFNPPAEQMETLTVESPIPTVSSPVPTTCLNDFSEPSSKARLVSKRVANQEETPSLDNILSLTNRFEDILEVSTSSDEIIGVEADNLRRSLMLCNTQDGWNLCKKSSFNSKSRKSGLWLIVLKSLVAQGHTQEEWIDFDEVFAPVARIKAIRLFLAYASVMGFTVYQIDVKSAFLYCTIDEEVYVMQPPEFQDPEFPSKVYKVEKAISTEGGWHFSLSRQVCRRYPQEIRIFRCQIIKYSHGQRESLGKRRNWKISNTPIDKENPWGKDGPGKDMELYLYRSMIGSLMYLTASRLDIMFVVCACARHQVTPKECHLYAVKRNFRYLKGHPKLGLWYPKESPFDLVAYSDSDYGGAWCSVFATFAELEYIILIIIIKLNFNQFPLSNAKG